jgi:Cft2 family RNA processing exonuclease
MTPLGGAREFSGSAFVIEVWGTRLLIDAGGRSSPSAMRPGLHEFASLAGAPDLALITEGSYLHAGSLPLLVRRFPTVNVVATAPTRALLAVVLGESAGMQARTSDRRTAGAASYTRREVDDALARIRVVGYDDWIVRTVGDVTVGVRAVRSGRLLGAASFQIVLQHATGGEIRLVHLGMVTTDVHRSVAPWDLDAHVAFRPHVVLTEAGAAPIAINELATIDAEPAQVDPTDLRAVLLDAVRRGERVLIPVGAVGRAQEIAWAIRRWNARWQTWAIANNRDLSGPPPADDAEAWAVLRREPMLPNMSCFVDGLARVVTEVYEHYRDGLTGEITRAVSTLGTALYDDRFRIFPVKSVPDPRPARQPCVILAPSSAGTSGRFQWWLRELGADARTTVALPADPDEEPVHPVFTRIAATPRPRVLDLTGAPRLVGSEPAGSERPAHLTLAGRIVAISVPMHPGRGELMAGIAGIGPSAVLVVQGTPEGVETATSALHDWMPPGTDVRTGTNDRVESFLVYPDAARTVIDEARVRAAHGVRRLFSGVHALDVQRTMTAGLPRAETTVRDLVLDVLGPASSAEEASLAARLVEEVLVAGERDLYMRREVRARDPLYRLTRKMRRLSNLPPPFHLSAWRGDELWTGVPTARGVRGLAAVRYLHRFPRLAVVGEPIRGAAGNGDVHAVIALTPHHSVHATDVVLPLSWIPGIVPGRWEGDATARVAPVYRDTLALLQLEAEHILGQDLDALLPADAEMQRRRQRWEAWIHDRAAQISPGARRVLDALGLVQRYLPVRPTHATIPFHHLAHLADVTIDPYRANLTEEFERLSGIINEVRTVLTMPPVARLWFVPTIPFSLAAAWHALDPDVVPMSKRDSPARVLAYVLLSARLLMDGASTLGLVPDGMADDDVANLQAHAKGA